MEFRHIEHPLVASFLATLHFDASLFLDYPGISENVDAENSIDVSLSLILQSKKNIDSITTTSRRFASSQPFHSVTMSSDLQMRWYAAIGAVVCMVGFPSEQWLT